MHDVTSDPSSPEGCLAAAATPTRAAAVAVPKRALDLTLGSLLALLALPVIALLALTVAMQLRAWPFFTQRRPGFRGRPFTIVKIRTLPKTAPRYASKLDMEIAGLRLPLICRLLRRTHLDELPQLLLVPLGRMSLVGPRPRQPDGVEPVDAEFDRLRSTVRPGCTGLWQVGSAADLLINGAPVFDLFYLRHACLRLDLWLMARTLPYMLRLVPPVEVADVPRWARGAGLVREPIVLPVEDPTPAVDAPPAIKVVQVNLTMPALEPAPAATLTDA